MASKSRNRVSARPSPPSEHLCTLFPRYIPCGGKAWPQAQSHKRWVTNPARSRSALPQRAPGFATAKAGNYWWKSLLKP